MAVSIPIVAIVTSLHLIAFIFAVGAERHRSTTNIVPDKYDERTYCVYGTDASTVYGLAACGLLLVSQALLNGVTRCLCCGKGLVTGSSNYSTGCIFEYDTGHPLGSGVRFKEEDTPNFIGSFYSKTKAMVEDLLNNFKNVFQPNQKTAAA